MPENLSDVEEDFIEFLSSRRRRPADEIKRVYLETKSRFRFSGLEYRQFVDKIHHLTKVLYDDSNEEEILDSYRFHALIHLFRYLSYSNPQTDFLDDVRFLVKPTVLGEFKTIATLVKQKLSEKKAAVIPQDYPAAAKLLLEHVEGPPVVVDYGCGLAYISFEIARIREDAKVYLVDVDSLMLEFTHHRFRKHGLKAEVIRVSEKELYPLLPYNNICIATEVMEHCVQPLRAYENIQKSLKPGGLLYGDFSDHHEEMYHVSPDLSELRKKMEEDFEEISENLYRRK